MTKQDWFELRHQKYLELKNVDAEREAEPQSNPREHEESKHADLLDLLIEPGDRFTVEGHKFVAGHRKAGNYEITAYLQGGKYPVEVTLSVHIVPETAPTRVLDAYVDKKRKKRKERKAELQQELAKLEKGEDT